MKFSKPVRERVREVSEITVKSYMKLVNKNEPGPGKKKKNVQASYTEMFNTYHNVYVFHKNQELEPLYKEY